MVAKNLYGHLPSQQIGDLYSTFAVSAFSQCLSDTEVHLDLQRECLLQSLDVQQLIQMYLRNRQA